MHIHLRFFNNFFFGAECTHASTMMKDKSFSPPMSHFNENLKKFRKRSQKFRYTSFNSVYKIVNHVLL